MKKNYIVLFVFLILFLISLKGFSQSIIKNIPVQTHIEGLTIYPNPVANGKVFVYVSTKKNISKKIEVYNVLGKKVSVTNLSGKELSISQFSSGVYFLKITENSISETRKLVLK